MIQCQGFAVMTCLSRSCRSGKESECQYRLKIPHSSGRKFPTPEPQKGASLASDGAEPSAVFWRVLGEAESEAKEVGAAAPSCPRGGTRPARRRSFSRWLSPRMLIVVE